MSDSPRRSSLPSPAAPQRRRRWLRILLWSGCGLLVLLALAPLAAVLWLRSAAKAALPQLDGDVHLAGLSAPVIVRRDAHGVPHIEAATEDDLFVAQGYVTAQDRLWQMDASRRNSDGDLAEVMGPALIEHDKTQRVLQIRVTAQRFYSNLSADDRRRLDDYARGVNLFIAQCERSNTLPVEFRLLHYRPQAWTGADSISVGLSMVQTLDTHIATKLSRARVAAKLTNPALEADLYPVGSWRDRPPTGIRVDLSEPQPRLRPRRTAMMTMMKTPRRAPCPILSRPLRKGGAVFAVRARTPARQPAGTPALLLPLPSARALSSHFSASPVATVAPQAPITGSLPVRTRPAASRSSRTICTSRFASRTPGTWLTSAAPGFHAAGVTLPGFPLVIAGHNEHVAWGFTALYGDVQDLYIEKLDGKGNYEGLDAAWHPLTVDREVIHVRGGKDVVLNVQSTAHGPLLNPLLSAGDQPTALKWTLYDPTLTTLPIYEMNTASNWAEFSAALVKWCWPTQNLVYADDQGHIAYHAIGRIPLRPAGIADAPIRDKAHEWQGYIPLRRDAQRRRPAFGISGHRQRPRHHRQIAVPTHRRVGRSLPHRAHLQIARRPRPSHACRHARRAD